MAAPIDDSTKTSLDNLSSHISGGVIVDIGTGDGRFVYQSARTNPAKFYIGIDAQPKLVEKISMKATRNPAKGGARNVLFLQASVEDLPSELNDSADEIHIHFPWGSLLRAIATADENVLRGLYRISRPDGLLEVVIGIDAERDRSQIQQLGLPHLSVDYVDKVLTPRYGALGFKIRERGILPRSAWSQLHSSWARRLQPNDRRQVVYLIAEARK